MSWAQRRRVVALPIEACQAAVRDSAGFGYRQCTKKAGYRRRGVRLCTAHRKQLERTNEVRTVVPMGPA